MPALGCRKFTRTCRRYHKKLQYLYCLPYAGTVFNITRNMNSASTILGGESAGGRLTYTAEM